MFRILFVIIMLALFSTSAFTAPIAGHGVSTAIPENKRYQFYEGVGGGATLEIDVANDLGRSAYLGYVTNNTGATVYLHINYSDDSGDTMNKIKILDGYIWNFSPSNLTVDSLEFTSAGTIDIDVMVH